MRRVATPDDILNAMTVDVEEHFQVSAFEFAVRREEWGAYPSRVRSSTEKLLDVFEETGVKATFFVLGAVAQRNPELVRRIAERGHEVASHGYSHKLVYTQSPEEFRRETVLARQILQDLSGQEVTGYRAASFSIGPRNAWALDVISETGFAYDSSLFPIRHDRYGFPGAPRCIHRVDTPSGHSVVEVPPSTLRFGRFVLPVGGGGYLRLYPRFLTRWAIDRLNRQEGMPAVVYVHPWEVDPEQPRIAVPLSVRFRHYVGIRGTASKLKELTTRYRFGPVAQVIESAGGISNWPIVPVGSQ